MQATWRDHVSSEFLNRANEALDKSRENLRECKRWRAENWLELRCIETEANLRNGWEPRT